MDSEVIVAMKKWKLDWRDEGRKILDANFTVEVRDWWEKIRILLKKISINFSWLGCLFSENAGRKACIFLFIEKSFFMHDNSY